MEPLGRALATPAGDLGAFPIRLMPGPSVDRWLPRAAAPVLLALVASVVDAQEPLFTFVQISDSQPQTELDEQAFDDVLGTIAVAGQLGALLPRPIDLVLFAGDITYGNTRSEWIAAREKLDRWLTASDIPYLAVPGNHDVNNSDTALYEEYIGDPGVWHAGSVAFTGQNGPSRTTFWKGLRFIGVNNSNPGWNTIPAADVATIQALVASAQAARENVFLLAHHPHDDRERMPLGGVLPNPTIIGYLHGHSGSPHVMKGLAGVVNPMIWDVDSNAIYQDRGLIYFEVFPGELHAYVVVLNSAPTALPAPKILPLAYALTPTVEPNAGFADGSHAGARAGPTSRAPERKLWRAAGAWWGVLWSAQAGAYRIHRLDPATQTWVDAGPAVSSSAGRSFDALAGATSVVIASNLVTTPGESANGSPGLLTRFTLTAGSWVLDADYPVAISDARSPTLVLARDGLDVLWAAWTRDGAAFVAHTLGADSVWSAPIALAGALGGTDTIALTSLGDSLGALWTDAEGHLRFARHLDGDAAGTWTEELVATRPELAGAALDLVAADGRALAAVRGADGALDLWERAGGGVWRAQPLGDPADALADPLLVVDRAFGRLRLFASGPTLTGQSADGGGALYTKHASLSTLAFPPGRGTPVIQDGNHPSAAFATSTRADVDGAAGLVVLAGVGQTERYWHAFDALSALPAAPVAEFAASPLAGSAPVLVRFSDLSSGAPTYWSWDFGDGTSSTEREPQHAYAEPGTYSVTLRVANGAGEDARTRKGFVVVTPPAPSQVFRPVADARVNEANPTANLGRDASLRVRLQPLGTFESYLRFDLGALTGTVTSVKLRLFCTDGSNGGGSVFAVADDSWGETTINWANRPAKAATPLAVMGGVTLDFWTEIELGSAAVTGGGLVSLAVAGGTTNSALYYSREGAYPPELVVTYAGTGTAPSADFSGSPLSGPAPLAVTFTDLSSGVPSAWAWDFGDGATSSERNPTHVYTEPGVYTVVLDASNASGLDARTRLDYVTVTAPPPVRVFAPMADVQASEAKPARNFAADAALRVRVKSGGSFQSFLRFDVGGLAGEVVSAKLRLYCMDAGPAGCRVHVAPTTWTETGLVWNNRPALPPAALATLGAMTVGQWVEIDVTSLVTGPGAFAFALAAGTSNTVGFSSREGTRPPELVVTTTAAAPPVADFAATPLAGPAPLSVAFTDLSAGASGWLWDFGDGSSSSERNPVHVYTTSGTYTVTLQASNAHGSSMAVRADLIGVSPPPTVRVLSPVADARVNEANPSGNSGADVTLRVRQALGGSYHSYIRFDLAGLGGSVLSARLRLFATDGSDVAGIVYPTSGTWGERTITWTNKPAPTGPAIWNGGAVATGAWTEIDVTSAVTGAGTLDLVLQSTSSNSCYYSSREGAQPPELVVTTAAP